MSERVSVVLTGAAGIAAVATALLFKNQIPLSSSVARALGFSTLYGGMAVFVWAAVHLRGAIAGGVAPPLDGLVVRGPFRYVRHPVYVAMTIALIGASLVTRSGAGLLVVVVLFVPVEIHRARLEDRALEEKYGGAWREYAARTGFFVPWIGKREA
jgi:protein-S-isoprenylcysteine O-methyltransferase Ste14